MRLRSLFLMACLGLSAIGLELGLLLRSPAVAQTQSDSASEAESISSWGRSAIELTEDADGAIQPVSISGRLDENSEMLSSGNYFNRYTFEGKAGRAIVIEIASREFDPYLGLLNASHSELIALNDNRDTTNSQIVFTPSITSSYSIAVSSSGVAQTGSYTLNIRAATAAEVTRATALAEAERLNAQGIAQGQASEYRAALQLYEQALVIYREQGDRNGQARTLLNHGFVYLLLDEYEQAIAYFQQALSIFEAVRDRTGQADTLTNLGNAYFSMSQYEQAIVYHRQALPLFEAVGSRGGQANVLASLGVVYNNLSEYEQAIAYYRLALPLLQLVNDRNGQATVLINLGTTYLALSEYEQAIAYYQQSLSIFQNLDNRNGQADALVGLGAAHSSLSEYEPAIAYYQRAIPIFQTVNDRDGRALALMNLGTTYLQLSEYEQAIESYQQALLLFQAVGNLNGQAHVLTLLGSAYASLSESEQALAYYQQALPIFQAVGNRDGAGRVLANMGYWFHDQNQPELAIVFFKQSVNLRESIRADIQNLSQDLQQSYVDNVADDYRQLADLLISQGRLGEAQQVLELLKLQELRDFTRSADVGGAPSQLPLADVEQQMLDQFGTLTAFSQRLYECEQNRCSDLGQLRDLLDARTIEFNTSIEQLRQTLRERLAQDPGFLSSDALNTTARSIVHSAPGTVLVYPLVLENKIRILLAIRSGDGVIFRAFEQDVDQQQLWQIVSQFRQQLSNPRSEIATVQATAGQLYDWLIAPLQVELQDQEVQHLVFALDRSTRYIPMAALFNRDRQQYLIEQYAVSTILAAELTNMNDRLSPNPAENRVLAMGVSMSVAGLPPLANVPTELNAIVQTGNHDLQGVFPGDEFLDRDFNFSALRDNLSDRRILHIATHAKFESGRPEDSFLLSGDGEIRIDRIQTLNNYGLNTVHLVVLSACETALGGPDESGIEIPGISYYFLRNGAQSVLASLWLVNDRSTSTLMQQFYTHLASGMTKTEALRQAQLSLLNGNGQAANFDRFGDGTVSAVSSRTGEVRSSVDVRHPYYWAPFILIGNGL